MRENLIKPGLTYWDRADGLRRIESIYKDGYGEVVVEYAMLSGYRNDPKTVQPKLSSDGYRVYGCYMRSFKVWAKERVEGSPADLLEKLSQVK